jgi:hypothetical protein
MNRQDERLALEGNSVFQALRLDRDSLREAIINLLGLLDSLPVSVENTKSVKAARAAVKFSGGK